MFPNNIGNPLTMFFGIVVLLYLIFEKRVINFCLQVQNRVCVIISSVILSIGFLGFVVFLIATLTQGITSPTHGKEVIIVLGTGLIGKSVSIPLASRLDRAFECYKNNPNAIIVVSGGQGVNEIISEAEAMANYLSELGIPRSKILLEDKSSNTWENFVFTKNLLDKHFDGKSFEGVFVTNKFHAFRSAYVAKKVGLKLECLAASSDPFYLLPNFYFREYLAVIDYIFLNLGEKIE